MVEYRIKGQKNDFVVDLPEHIDQRTKDIIEKTLKKCVEEKNQDRVMGAINQLISQTNAIITQLKEDGKYDEKLEKDIREFVGIHMKKGFDIGSQVIQPDEVQVVQKALAENMEYEKDGIEELKKPARGTARYILGSLELGKMSFEVGVTLGILISMEKADLFYSNGARDLPYIH